MTPPPTAPRTPSHRDAAWLEGALDRPVADLFGLYAEQRAASMARALRTLGVVTGAPT